MDEGLQFVARRLAGEAMAELCREFGISRKTGYKIFDRYKECGVRGLTDRGRRPYRYAHQLPFQVENFILNVKREHTSWGARKIRERLILRHQNPRQEHHPCRARSPRPSRRLGIGIERIKPGHPQQNGRHERRHLTLKKETTKPAGLNFLQQQARFDDFIEIFNNQRPHEALDMKCPAEVYQPSTRADTGLPDIDYPFHDKIIVVTHCGRISTSALSSPARRSASKKFTTISGWSSLWIMIWDGAESGS